MAGPDAPPPSLQPGPTPSGRRAGGASAVTLADAADALNPPYRLVPSTVQDVVILRDGSGDLPDLRLSLQRERRPFSRVMAMVTWAALRGEGPVTNGEAELRRGVTGRPSIRWRSARDPSRFGSMEGGGAIARFREAGILHAASHWPTLRRLTIGWDVASGTWRLRMESVPGPDGRAIAPPAAEALLGILRSTVAATRPQR